MKYIRLTSQTYSRYLTRKRTKIMKEDYAELIYVLSSLAALIVFAISFVIYLLSKNINIYLIGIGLLMLGIGFITKKRLDKMNKP